jgi:hypothetical protein
MNRVDALIYLKPRFDKLMLGIGAGVADDIEGYGSTLDASFQRYIDVNGLVTNVMDTMVESDDTSGFTVMLNAVEYDFLIPFYAMTPDLSVDAPLTNVKFSQTYRALKELRDEAWANAADYGYIGSPLNAGGFVLNLSHNEPTLAEREFG